MKARAHVALVAALVGLLGTATPASASTTTRHLHESDSGRTIHVSRGDVIKVRLPGGSAGGYHRPRTSDGHVVQRTNASGGYPSGDVARGRFVARHRGNADLTSYTDYRCLHTQPRCLPPQREWTVHVIVH
jgi:N-methylhydantoinase B/oxoprolinase/acetone carboxylase alpha subunit